MTTNAARPAHNEDATQNQRPQGETAMLGENWQQQIAEVLQPAVASIQQQVARAAEQQLEPLRSRIQHLTEQQLEGMREDTPQQGKALPKDEGAVAEKQEPSGQEPPSSDVERQRGDSQQQRAPISRSLVRVPSLPSSEEESALQRWGETLEGAAVIVLALGEVLEGLALLLQMFGLVVGGGKPTPQPDQETSPQEEREEEEGDAAPHTEREEPEPSLAQKVGDTVSGGVSSLKQTVSQAVGSGSPSHEDGWQSSLQQWGRILEHAAALVQTLGDGSGARQGGLASMQRWGTIMKQATPLVKELNQVLGDGSSSQRGDGGMQRWGRVLERAASVVQALGDGSSQKHDDDKSSGQEQKGGSSSDQEQDDKSSSKQEGGGISSALQTLAGDSSSKQEESKKEDEGGSSLLDALTGESSPLQTLREFSKRQQGPGGLAPKGPINRKPPPGPLRRDRLPHAG